jgi:hypothetical protein
MNRSEAGSLGGKFTAIIFRQQALDNYNTNPNYCKHCNNKIEVPDGAKIGPIRRKKFCDRSCAAKYNNKGRLKEFHKCKTCDNKVPKDSRTYCDVCVEDGKHVRKIKHIEDAKCLATIARYLRRTREHMCECCKNSEWNDKPIPLESHHIDGNGDNNKDSNLQLLCPNCHAQTDTFKNKNTGKGRHARRERYKDGKSY